MLSLPIEFEMRTYCKEARESFTNIYLIFTTLTPKIFVRPPTRLAEKIYMMLYSLYELQCPPPVCAQYTHLISLRLQGVVRGQGLSHRPHRIESSDLKLF